MWPMNPCPDRRRSPAIGAWTAVALAVLALSGCGLPYPVYKTLQPRAEARVLSIGGEALVGAEVNLISSSHPYGEEKTRQLIRTDQDGVARFAPRREWRIEVLMVHGSEEFFWNWCVRAPGFQTVSTSLRSSKGFVADWTVRLQPGVSEPCALDWDQPKPIRAKPAAGH